MSEAQPIPDGDASDDIITDSSDDIVESEAETHDSIFDQDTDVTEAESEGEAKENEDSGESSSDESDAAETQITLDDLAAYLGSEADLFDVSEEGQVLFKTKIDGKEEARPLKDIIRSYQTQGHLDNQNREVKQLQEKLKTQLETNQAQVTERLNQADDLIRVAWSELQGEDRNQRDDEDDGEYAARMLRLQSRENALTQKYQQVQEARNQTAQQQAIAYFAEAEKRLVEAFPKWADAELGKKEMESLREFGMTLGFTREQVSQAVEAPFFKMADMARQFAELQKGKPEVKRLLRVAPKTSESGKPAKQPEKTLSAEELFYGKN